MNYLSNREALNKRMSNSPTFQIECKVSIFFHLRVNKSVFIKLLCLNPLLHSPYSKLIINSTYGYRRR